MKLHEWLRKKLAEKRINIRQAAKALGIHHSNLVRLLKGERQIKAHELRRIAELVGEPIPDEIVPTSPETVPLVGHVGAGAEIFPPDEDQELDRVPAPWREARELAAVVVRGGSMEPEFWDGDLIFYEPPNGMSDPEEMVGRTVVCRTEDGRTFVKRLLRGSKPGLWTLESHAAPPMKDVRLVWVAPIRYIKRAGP